MKLSERMFPQRYLASEISGKQPKKWTIEVGI
jgi:hypothetical protein